MTCVSRISNKIYEQIFVTFSGVVGRGQRKNLLDFGGDRDSFMDPGSFYRIF